MVLLLAAAAVLGGVILVALGRGGEMATFPADYAPLDLERVTAADVALLQPPRWLWGYSAQVTEEALQVIAKAVSDRDVEIERLRQQLAELRAGGRPPAPPAVAGQPAAVAAAAGDATAGEPAADEPAAGESGAGESAGGELTAAEAARAGEPARPGEPGHDD